MEDIAAENTVSSYHSINTSEKSSSDILLIGTPFGTLESWSRISWLVSFDLLIPVIWIHKSMYAYKKSMVASKRTSLMCSSFCSNVICQERRLCLTFQFYTSFFYYQGVLDTMYDLVMCDIFFLPMKALDKMYDLVNILFLTIKADFCQNYKFDPLLLERIYKIMKQNQNCHVLNQIYVLNILH